MPRAVYGSGGEAQHGPLGFQTKAMAWLQEENLHLLNKTSWCVPGPLQRQRAWTQEFKRLYKIACCQLGSVKSTELQWQVGPTAVHGETKAVHWDWAQAGLEATGSHVNRPLRPP